MGIFDERRQRKAEETQQSRNENFVRSRDIMQASQVEETYPGGMEDRRSDLLKWQQDLLDDLQMLKHDLRNEVQIDKKWVRQVVERWVKEEDSTGTVRTVLRKFELPPLMNEFGIQMVESNCRPLLSRNLINSNLSEERILMMLRDTANAIVDNMADNYDCIGAEFVNYDYILRMVKNVMLPTPFRALNGWNKRQDTTSSKRIEAFHDGAELPKKKWGII